MKTSADWRAAFPAQLSGERKLRLVTQDHSGSFTPGVSGREKKIRWRRLCFILAFFHMAEVGRNPTFRACFLSREWKIWRGELELAIQIPRR